MLSKYQPKHWLPSGKLTQQWNITIFNRKYIFKRSIFHCMLVYRSVTILCNAMNDGDYNADAGNELILFCPVKESLGPMCCIHLGSWYRVLPKKHNSVQSQAILMAMIIKHLFSHTSKYLKYLGSTPHPVTVVNEGLQGFPIKSVIILVVTVTGRGVRVDPTNTITYVYPIFASSKNSSSIIHSTHSPFPNKSLPEHYDFQHNSRN